MNLIEIETKYWDIGNKYIAGIDEAGRGPLAGPVVAACVILKPYDIIEGVKDSKKISEKKRSKLFIDIYNRALSIGVGIINNSQIDKLNILQATFLAMNKSIGNLSIDPDLILVDGPKSNVKLYPVNHIVNGDNLSQSIAAASIIAKVTRDNIMIEYDKIFPEYNFIKHKGYGTKYHIEQIKKIKSSPVHRRTFKIVKNNMPDYNYIKTIRNGYKKLGNNIIGMNFIQEGYKIIDQCIKLDNNYDIIDYFMFNDDLSIYRYIKIITIENNRYKSFGNNSVSNVDDYIEKINEYIKKNNCVKNFTFNVISIEFIKSNKPKINIIHEIFVN